MPAKMLLCPNLVFVPILRDGEEERGAFLDLWEIFLFQKKMMSKAKYSVCLHSLLGAKYGIGIVRASVSASKEKLPYDQSTPKNHERRNALSPSEK